MTLSQWHDRLAEHFSRLRERKANLAAGNLSAAPPVFALEHGLNPDELAALKEVVRAYSSSFYTPIKSDSYIFSGWLPWVVYAAEVGYEFAGGEYWDSFREGAPAWHPHGVIYCNDDRNWLRDRFEAFEDHYHGAKPAGHWAEKFSIICWPITHAILPKDLQVQLAKILYRVSSGITVGWLENTEALGKLVETAASGSSSRFQQFARDHRLVGYIAASLLLEDLPGIPYHLDGKTVRRIASDLKQHSEARDWLKRARERVNVVWHTRDLAQPTPHLTPQVTIAGRSAPDRYADAAKYLADHMLGVTTPGTPAPGRYAPEGPGLVVQLKLALLLRRVAPRSWQMVLRFPDLSCLLSTPGWASLLQGANSFVAGSSRRLAPGRFLHGDAEIPLERPPNPGEPLLRFDGHDKARPFPPGVQWILSRDAVRLFLIGTDGVAREMVTKSVRSGCQYVLVHTQPGQPISQNAVYQTATVRGAASAIELRLPSSLSPQLQEFIRKLGLNQAAGVWLWPAGTPPISWDDESRAEWLSTDVPTIGMRFDHRPGPISLELRSPGLGLRRVLLPPPGDEQNLFVQLRGLSVGSHLLTVRVQPQQHKPKQATMQMEIRIREPRQWLPEPNEEVGVVASTCQIGRKLKAGGHKYRVPEGLLDVAYPRPGQIEPKLGGLEAGRLRSSATRAKGASSGPNLPALSGAPLGSNTTKAKGTHFEPNLEASRGDTATSNATSAKGTHFEPNLDALDGGPPKSNERSWISTCGFGRPKDAGLKGDPPTPNLTRAKSASSVPNLESLGGGPAEFHIQGPKAGTVQWTISLYEGRDLAPILTKTWRSELPSTADDIRKYINDHLPRWTEMDQDCEFCTRRELRLEGDERGSIVLRADRWLTPLSWIIDYRNASIRLQLKDDTGTGRVRVEYSSFVQPHEIVSLSCEGFLAGCDVSSKGGLYVALSESSSSTSRVAVVVSQNVRTLVELRVYPFVATKQAEYWFDAITRWREARTGDVISEYLRQAVLDTFNRLPGGSKRT